MKSLKKFSLPVSASRQNAIYDWEKMLDGGLYQLVEGDDFQAKPANMKMMIEERARKNYLNVDCRISQEDGKAAVIELQTSPMSIDERDKEDARRAKAKATREANLAKKAAETNGASS